MALLDDVKLALRIKTSAFDTEITPIIDACKIDLRLAGVNIIVETDPLNQRAVVLYAKANFGSNLDSEKYQKSYDLLKCSLAVAGDYNAYTITFTIKVGVNPIEDARITFNGEIRETNVSGVAVFARVREGVNQNYTVIANGYKDFSNVLDVTVSASITVDMVVI
jgi:hypothetical protein